MFITYRINILFTSVPESKELSCSQDEQQGPSVAKVQYLSPCNYFIILYFLIKIKRKYLSQTNRRKQKQNKKVKDTNRKLIRRWKIYLQKSKG